MSEELNQEAAKSLMRRTPRHARDLNLLCRELQDNVALLQKRTEELREYAETTLKTADRLLDRSATLAQLIRTANLWMTGLNGWDEDAINEQDAEN